MPFHPHALLAAVSLAEATPSVEPERSVWGLVLSVFSGVIAVLVAWLLGILRTSRTGIGHRVPLRRPIAPLLGALFAGFVVWQAAPILFLSGRSSATQHASTAPTTTKAFTLEDLSPRELILISAAAPTLAFLVLLGGDALVRPHVGQQLGFDRRRFPPGILFGVCGLLMALPLVWGTMVASEWAYRAIRYTHPSEHDLLRVMGETADPTLKYLMVAAAVLVAPLWEELLFRGHIQTVIRELLIRIAGPEPTTVAVASPVSEPQSGAPVFANAKPGTDSAAVARPHPAASWVAIILTSAMFAGVHTPWQMPAIFVLSLCLGFAYERTNNLWVSITMHATFNSRMTAYVFLSRA
jgi:membrane protease YdiL (CAAX protease family)